MSSTDNKFVSFSALILMARHQKSILHAKEILHQLHQRKKKIKGATEMTKIPTHAAPCKMTMTTRTTMNF